MITVSNAQPICGFFVLFEGEKVSTWISQIIAWKMKKDENPEPIFVNGTAMECENVFHCLHNKESGEYFIPYLIEFHSKEAAIAYFRNEYDQKAENR